MMRKWAMGKSRGQVLLSVKVSTSGTVDFHRLPSPEFGPFQREALGDKIINFNFTDLDFIKQNPDTSFLGRLLTVQSPNTDELAYSRHIREQHPPTEPPSWPQPMFATCWTCLQKGSLDHTKSKKWSRSDQVGVTCVIRNGIND